VRRRAGKTWHVLDHGDVQPSRANLIEYDCPHCGTEALLPVLGLAIAQCGSRLVFDRGPHAVPRRMRCRTCRHEFGLVGDRAEVGVLSAAPDDGA
jgi:DNA-directed RNA polymerase subunit RPC12/RpoP